MLDVWTRVGASSHGCGLKQPQHQLTMSLALSLGSQSLILALASDFFALASVVVLTNGHSYRCFHAYLDAALVHRTAMKSACVEIVHYNRGRSPPGACKCSKPTDFTAYLGRSCAKLQAKLTVKYEKMFRFQRPLPLPHWGVCPQTPVIPFTDNFWICP